MNGNASHSGHDNLSDESVDQRVSHPVLGGEDNGIGIAPADSRIFNMFERVHLETADKRSGIGLSIVRKEAERMGGAVGVGSTPGEGSAFWLELQRGSS